MLSLWDNRIFKIEQNGFQDLENLEELEFGQNEMFQIGPDLIQHM